MTVDHAILNEAVWAFLNALNPKTPVRVDRAEFPAYARALLVEVEHAAQHNELTWPIR